MTIDANVDLMKQISQLQEEVSEKEKEIDEIKKLNSKSKEMYLGHINSSKG